MKITDESKVFYHSVYALIGKIPYGKVTSYGHIAYLLNRPQNSRLVGSSLKHLKFIAESLNREANPEDIIEPESVPWWRVISSAGKISPRGNSDNESRQARFLREEGVEVSNAYRIDLEKYGWFPDEVDF
ncbi:DEHA2G06204p [Debaryomyces hansenii CBS767]|uniref:6-O-methylguanine-DNA methyltransferase n=1 Tax=Debaryomyces hansenii (strain ATCC 36239 / CBS 767 / BCRC 21394 / JCM 1990 / NBRC 0083 / IGC 2968) TaxID=284592 RepID=B5RV41_DEBHA|nr:DEHA2G06204p [Debaryomyces hansenii CBS767]CAR65920.1 DEHA2G06204p [Debaryomyces hansenii CBS767]|eukprot:XP_002770585.1 DEHA2G06204p [Debaryomyces hansenii CBS767]